MSGEPLSRRGRAATVGAVVLFCACFAGVGQAWLLHLFGVVSLLILGALWWGARRTLRPLLRLRPSDLIAGLLLGLVLVAATYPVYALASELFPPLRGEARRLYAAVVPTRSPVLLWLPLVAVVEELLWRGAVVELVSARLRSAALRHDGRARPALAALGALAAYAVGQAASGSWGVVALGLCLGAVWSAARLLSGRLWVPILSHAIWTGAVLGLWPLEI